MLGQRRRRWANNDPALDRYVVRVCLVLSVASINPYSAGIDFRRQNLTSVDVRL